MDTWYSRSPIQVVTHERPKLGEWCELLATGHKRSTGGKTNRVWQEQNLHGKSKRAMYIGYRTVYDGQREWEDEVGYIFTAHSHQEVWLFVCDPRQTPIYAFPCSVQRQTENGASK